MAGLLKFVKMHGLGNDYVVIDLFDSGNRRAFGRVTDLKSFAVKVCDRHFGVGADGVLLAMPPDGKSNDGRMRIINADGSEAEMCGNGIRCTAKLILDSGYSRRKELAIETMSGLKKIVFSGRLYRVDMGLPRLLRKEIPMKGDAGSKAINEPLQLQDSRVNVTAVSMGNPHAVIFVDSFDFDFEGRGREIECHPAFPKKANVEFVKVVSNGVIEVRVWERGVGETLACGTGSCAAVVACALNRRTSGKVKVCLKGGDLFVEWADDNRVYMSGPAEAVFSGTVSF